MNAVRKGITVAIVYEGRRQDRHIIQENLEDDFKEYFKHKSEGERETIKTKYFNKISLTEAEDRINDIAKDLLIHYRDNSYKLGFKAQIVTVSRHACVKYYESLMEHMEEVFPDNPIDIKVIYSCDNNDKPYLVMHRTSGTGDLLLRLS